MTIASTSARIGAKIGAAGIAMILMSACTPPEGRDYSTFRAQMPRSVLVLPPTNHSIEVNGPYSYLSTISRPLAEAGYYVFPVAVIDAFMKENGMSTPEDMHAVPIDKLGEIFGADAVLYVDLKSYGQDYKVVVSTAEVEAEARLVDVKTGAQLWEGRAAASDTTDSGGDGGLVELLITAAVAQAVGTTVDAAHGLSQSANVSMIYDNQDGFLLGPYHEHFEKDLRGREPVEAPQN